jgi:TetR/AcrR family transcriptional regulator, regulator of cefoperazone and chloramphenicol sensitivity
MIHARNMKEKTPRRAQPDSGDQRADDTRQKLLLAAIDVFGRHGFEGASTRMIASQAGANLQSIPYYFGGKEGLYVAAAEHIGSSIKARVHPVAARARSELATPTGARGAAPATEPARALLGQILGAMARLFLSDESEPWARFMIREQMEPTPAFDSLYAGVLEPVLEVLRALIGRLLAADPASETVRLRALATIGHVFVLRAARATLVRQLGWQQIGSPEQAAVDALIAQVVASIQPAPAAAAKPARTPKRTP